MILKDQVCIITGGGSGIGRATALRLAKDGCRIALIGRTLKKLENVKSEIEDLNGTAITFSLDVADYSAVEKMASDVTDQFGRIDILINNAGHSSTHRRLLNTTPDEIRSVIDSNLIGTFYCAKVVAPTMLKAKSGTIINIASVAGVSPGPFSGFAYGCAKMAVIGFNTFLNADLKNSGVRSSVIIPGEVDTPIIDNRPIVPSAEARATMVGVDEVADVIFMIATLPPRTNIPELVIRPTIYRDLSKEIVPLD